MRNSIPELQKVATHTGIPVVHIAGSIINRTKTIGRAIKDAGPLMFFELFLNAEFIFTNSLPRHSGCSQFRSPLGGDQALDPECKNEAPFKIRELARQPGW
ncbi:MAG: hypothetical protein ACJAT3_001563 [Akkermansiaceae bacterium]